MLVFIYWTTASTGQCCLKVKNQTKTPNKFSPATQFTAWGEFPGLSAEREKPSISAVAELSYFILQRCQMTKVISKGRIPGMREQHKDTTRRGPLTSRSNLHMQEKKISKSGKEALEGSRCNKPWSSHRAGKSLCSNQEGQKTHQIYKALGRVLRRVLISNGAKLAPE